MQQHKCFYTFWKQTHLNANGSIAQKPFEPNFVMHTNFKEIYFSSHYWDLKELLTWSKEEEDILMEYLM